MLKREKRKLSVVMVTALMTTEAPPTDPATPPSDPATPPATPPADDLSTLFTAEEVTAKKESIAAAKAEETRRAALTDEQRADEDKKKAEETAKSSVPEQYADFKVAEGMTLDAELLNEFKEAAKADNLSQEKAQKYVDFGQKIVQKTMAQLFEANEQRKAAWLEEAKKDAEIGEDVKLWDPKNPESAKNSVAVRAINTLMGQIPGLTKMMDDTGVGNHPDFIRIFYRIGKSMRPDSFEIPGTGGGSGNSVAERTGSIFNHPSRKG